MISSPTIGVCAAFSKGLDVVTFMINFGYKIEFIATCNKDNSVYEDSISSLCYENNILLKRKIDANSEEFINFLHSIEIDIVILAWWPTIIKKDAIAAVKQGWINLHPSLLPFNRGKHGYYWSIIDGTPFGVTIHFINEGIDSGKILFQKRIEVEMTCTGQQLYDLSAEEVVNLFKENYLKIIRLDFSPITQDEDIATTHFAKEINVHSNINLFKKYMAIDLINIIRGRTFINGDSAFFYYEGKKYFIRVNIEEASKID